MIIIDTWPMFVFPRAVYASFLIRIVTPPEMISVRPRPIHCVASVATKAGTCYGNAVDRTNESSYGKTGDYCHPYGSLKICYHISADDAGKTYG